MPFTGNNSILIEFEALVDLEMSFIQWIRKHPDAFNLRYFNKDKLLNFPIQQLKFKRSHGVENLFKSLLVDEETKNRSKNLFSMIMEQYEGQILEETPCATDVQRLVRAYKKAGGGIISITVRCSNDHEVKYIKSHFNFNVPIVTIPKRDIEMGKYTRLITANALSPLEYMIHEPKSIIVVNYRENFIEKDINILRPELVIKMGDIHDIQVINAYDFDLDKDFKIEG